jgi:hypothetical protein
MDHASQVRVPPLGDHPKARFAVRLDGADEFAHYRASEELCALVAPVVQAQVGRVCPAIESMTLQAYPIKSRARQASS